MGSWQNARCSARSKEVRFSMEDCERTGMHDINLASRKAEEAGQFFLDLFTLWMLTEAKVNGENRIECWHIFVF